MAMASIDLSAHTPFRESNADETSEGPKPPGSMIPKRNWKAPAKPMAIVAARLIAAEKIKRRSVQNARARAAGHSVAGAAGAGAGPVASRPSGPVANRPPLRTQNSSAGLATTRPPVRASGTTANRQGPSQVQRSSSVNTRPAITARGNAKAAAEQAIQQKAKPARFVSRHEQQLQRQLETAQAQKNARDAELETMRGQKAELEVQYGRLQIQANTDATELAQLRAAHSATLEELRQAQAMVTQQRQQLYEVTIDRDQIQTAQSATQAQLQAALKENRELRDELWKADKDRRNLHNLVLELKGNIRVFCRVRPILSEDFGVVTTLENISFPVEDDRKLEVRQPVKTNLSTPMIKNGSATAQPQIFEFDKVFGPESTQRDVFEEISMLVQSAIDGYNVCIFAYGQTGSGKTYTMEGPPSPVASQSPEPFGMIELSANRIFEHMTAAARDGWTFTVEASFIEIYNEQIYDLLTKDPNTASNKTYDIKLVSGASNEVHVPGVTTIMVASIEELKPLLQLARNNRAWASTKCNHHSSRSHSIFRMRLNGINDMRGVTTTSMISLVDLAGSENVKKSESVGQQLKEAQNINTSLMQLGKVITALKNGDSYVPYRDSKLTHLLQNSLGGNSKALMFVNISPEPDCINESVNSLRFATQVNQCHIGTAKKNVAGKSK